MLENLRRKSLTKTYHDPRHRVAFELGYARYENHLSIDQYKQRFSKENMLESFQNPFNQVSKEFRLFSYSLDNVKFNMIACPSGSFTMGHKDQDDNKPRTEIIERPFLLGETEITQELYEKVMGTNPSDFKHPQKPVEMVSWESAILFCNKLSDLQGLDKCYTKKSSEECDWLCDFTKNGYRLPTEKEWEYDAKAGTENKWVGTDDGRKLKKYAVYSDSNYSTRSVGSKDPNEWGFYDMSGNVYEWCWDKYNPNNDNASAFRVYRGGSWRSNNLYLRSAIRNFNSPGLRNNALGFRVARSIVN